MRVIKPRLVALFLCFFSFPPMFRRASRTSVAMIVTDTTDYLMSANNMSLRASLMRGNLRIAHHLLYYINHILLFTATALFLSPPHTDSFYTGGEGGRGERQLAESKLSVCSPKINAVNFSAPPSPLHFR